MIHNIKDMQFTDAYGIQCAALPINDDRDGCYATFCRIPAYGQTMPGAHYETELFYIISGVGEMVINGKSQTVSAGDLIHIDAFSDHQLKNHSDTAIEFLSVYSEDLTIPALPKQVTITTAPPTPNGPLHLGHISGPYLAADILCRYLRLREVKVLSHTGMDDHQNYVLEAAKLQGQEVSNFLADTQARIHAAFNRMNIKFDKIDYPASDTTYKHKITAFFQRAKSAGIIKKEYIELPYCNGCHLVLIDGLIKGTCPACGSLSNGACEVCGNVISPEYLTQSHCTRCLEPANRKHVHAYTFSLSTYLPIIESELANLAISEHIKKITQYASATNDLKIIVAYPSSNAHGIHVDDGEFVLHVWFEMAANYEQFMLDDRYWIHTFGFDNAFYYLLYIPALLGSLNNAEIDSSISTTALIAPKFPDQVITNEFLQLDHKKLSTSKQHAIWADEFNGNSDHLRLYLCMQRPDTITSNFDVIEYNNFSIQLTYKLEKLHAIASNQKPILNDKFSRHTLLKTNRFVRSIESAMHPAQLNLRDASRQLLNFIDDVIHQHSGETSTYISARALVMVMQIFMPQEAISLSLLLGTNPSPWIKDWSPFLCNQQ